MDFEHYLASMWNKCNCMIVWTFFDIALLWAWNENWTFPVLWPLLSFPNLLKYWVQHFNSIILRIWNSSAGIPSPPLVLSIVNLPKSHLTSHSRMSGSRWVTTSSWLFRSLWPFSNSSVYSCHLFLISSVSARSTYSVLYCYHLGMKCSLGISTFLMEYIFSFLPWLWLLFLPKLFVKLPQTTTLPSCIFLWDGFYHTSCTMLWNCP